MSNKGDKHLSIHSKTWLKAEEAFQNGYVSSGIDFGEVQPSSTLQMSTAPTLDNPLSPIFQFSPCKGTQPLAHSVGDLIKYFVASFKCAVSSRLCSQIPSRLFKIAVMESGGHEFLQ